MISMQRGMRGKIGQLFDPVQEIVLQLQTDGQAIYDYSCFGVDSAGKLSDDRYMIFYNQTASPEKAVSYAENGQGAEFRVRLSALPPTIDKLVFTVSIDGAGTMHEIRSHLLTVSQNGTEQLRLSLQGTDFHAERAIVLFEIYRKGEWRYAAVASGFDGGLADLLRFFGGEEVTEQAEPAAEPEEPVFVPAAEEIAANAGNTEQPVVAEVPQTAEPVFPEPEEPVFAPAVAEIAADAGNTEQPVVAEVPQSAEPVFPEPEETVIAPAAEEIAADAEHTEQTVTAEIPAKSELSEAAQSSVPAASHGAAHSFPDPVRIPPPVIPPPVFTPPVIPVPLCRTPERQFDFTESDVLAEMQQFEDTTENE